MPSTSNQFRENLIQSFRNFKERFIGDIGAGTVAQSLSTKTNKSESIKNITRSGTTFTATRADNTTFTFTQQDNNTTYSIREYSATPSNLAAFVQGTATGTLTSIFKFKDNNNVLGLGANRWVKGYIQYQNAYGGANDVSGTGIVSIQEDSIPFIITIRGTYSTYRIDRRYSMYEHKYLGTNVTFTSDGEYIHNFGTNVMVLVATLESGYGVDPVNAYPIDGLWKWAFKVNNNNNQTRHLNIAYMVL